MTKLEEEIYKTAESFRKELDEDNFSYDVERVYTEKAAEVAKRYIEKAFTEAPLIIAEENAPTQQDLEYINQHKAKWLKENGIIE